MYQKTVELFMINSEVYWPVCTKKTCGYNTWLEQGNRHPVTRSGKIDLQVQGRSTHWNAGSDWAARDAEPIDSLRKTHKRTQREDSFGRFGKHET